MPICFECRRLKLEYDAASILCGIYPRSAVVVRVEEGQLKRAILLRQKIADALHFHRRECRIYRVRSTEVHSLH